MARCASAVVATADGAAVRPLCGDTCGRRGRRWIQDRSNPLAQRLVGRSTGRAVAERWQWRQMRCLNCLCVQL